MSTIKPMARVPLLLALLVAATAGLSACSSGERSGQYGGKSTAWAPWRSIASRLPATLWAPKVSSITTSPAPKVGPRTCATYAWNTAPSVAPCSTWEGSPT